MRSSSNPPRGKVLGGKSCKFSCALESMEAWHGLGIQSISVQVVFRHFLPTEAVDVEALMFFEVQSLMFLWCSRLPWSLLELSRKRQLRYAAMPQGSVEQPCVKWTCATVFGVNVMVVWHLLVYLGTARQPESKLFPTNMCIPAKSSCKAWYRDVTD